MSLTYGSLVLTSSPYLIEFGMDTGAPQNTVEALAFLLQDGEVELSSRASNRTLQFNVLIEGANLLALATAEAALVAETEKPLNTITIDPGDSGPATVHSTFRAQVALVRDDDWEQSRVRRYSVTVKASPFPRSATEVTVAALAATGTTNTLVDAASATTGWTATVNGVGATVSVVSGAVKASSSAVTGGVVVSLSRSGSITTSSTNLLKIDWKPEAGAAGNPDLRAYGDGVELQKVASTPSPTAGYTRTWFKATTASISTLRLDSASNVEVGGFIGYADPAVRSLYIDNIDRTDIKPAIGTGRQLQRTLPIGGSARGQVGIAVEHASSSLGDTIVYTFPDEDGTGRSLQGYSPPLRQYSTGSAVVTTDSTKISGGTQPLNAGTSTFDIPLRSLPLCSHLLVARLFGAGTPATINWSAQVFLSAVASVSPTLSGSLTGTIGTGNYALGKLNIPNDVDDAASAAILRITLSSTSAIPLDEAWLFGDIGQLVMVRCGTGAPGIAGSSNRLWINPPTVTRPRPSIRVGFAADRSDSYTSTVVEAWQFPELTPPLANVLTVTSNALDASVSAKGYPRWHTNAAS